MTRRLVGAALVLVGAGAFAACLRPAFTGMRDVMVTDGGFCASGGPYLVAHQCSGADMRLLLVGILGGLVAVAVYSPLFAVLTGELRTRNGPSGNGYSGSGPSRVINGPPLVRAVIPPGLGISPDPGFGGWPTSGTTALGLSGAVTDAVGPPRPSAWSSIGLWLVTSAVGGAAGLVIGSLLVSALR